MSKGSVGSGQLSIACTQSEYKPQKRGTTGQEISGTNLIPWWFVSGKRPVFELAGLVIKKLVEGACLSIDCKT